jgi:peptidoglycan hydrolase-like protein with peptidoglycan-binding domain
MHALPRPVVARRLVRGLPLLAALCALLLTAAPAGAALTYHGWPVQSVGNRGADVLGIQSLLRGRGFYVAFDGVFTENTRNGVLAFQAAKGLPKTGVVDTSTWAKLVVTVKAGSAGALAREGILTLQRQLNAKRGAGLTTTGVFDSATTSAVRAFERHVGITVDGVADYDVWRYLVSHHDLPSFAKSLCDYSVGNGAANWGTGAAVGQIEAAGAAMVAAGLGRIPVGDIGWEHGGDIAGHQTHERGLDVDIRPMRDARNQCTWGTNWRLASYDRAATRALVKAIRATAPRHVKLIYFNDPVLIQEGWTTWYTGHDDHLHVRYCEIDHAVSAYRC